VSHDRYFLDRTVQRLLVIRPPQVIDFAHNYSAWLKKSASENRVGRQKRIDAKPQAASTATTTVAAKPKKDNPYARPFGRLTSKELEKQITDTEIAINECQQQFGDAETMKDSALAKKLQAEYEQLNSKLQQLEAEYFAREQ
jgi:ATP-binding cassette subfamily F protein uup